jgi:LPXTG-motif cell wall-anchored protein
VRAPARALPRTGAPAADLLALGLASLGAGGVLLRRARLALAT